ncbi:FAD-dependent oxidoreductase [Brachybacterium sp. EF45031]|nr:FAD-dependent oxidoreductase [Brachybacterium sillae]
MVVGGGITGLLAARQHAAAGHEVVVLEAEDAPGGAVAAVELGGLPVNAGAEAFSVAGGAVERLATELRLPTAAPRSGLSSRLVSADGVHVAPGGGVLGIPGDLSDPAVRAVLGRRGTWRARLDAVLPARIGDRPGVTVQQLVRRRMGRAVADRLVAPLVGGVHSADPATLDLEAVAPALLPALREHGSLAAAVRALRTGGRSGRPGEASAGTAVRAITPTMAELPAALSRDLDVRTGRRVTAVQRGADGDWAVAAEDGETHRADHLVLALSPAASRVLLAQAAPRLAAAIPETPAAPVRLVALLLDAPALDDFPSGTGALVAPHTPGIRAKALTHASAKWEHVQQAAQRAVGPHGHVVRLSYGRPGEELPAEDGLVDLALADASAILQVPLTRAQLRDARIITWPEAMRPPRRGHRQSLTDLDAALEDEPRLELVGSWRAGPGLAAIVTAAQRRGTPTPHTLPTRKDTPDE